MNDWGAILSAHAEAADSSTHWPTESWQALATAGLLAGSVSRSHGGDELDAVELLRQSEAIAGRCLTTTFILSQREAAIRRIRAAPNELQDQYLPAAARGEGFLTLGLSQLTTSRQHGGPALRAQPGKDGGYRLNGEIPWVTGADQASAIVIGATLDDGKQILMMLPAATSGMEIAQPMPLLALRGSRTTTVHCHDVHLGKEYLIAGPEEQILGKIGGGGLETSCLALGLAQAATDFVTGEAVRRKDFVPVANHFQESLARLRTDIHRAASLPGNASDILQSRVRATALAQQTTQAALMAAKGAGFLAPHSAQRWARQALFFLVWSCPKPVSEGLLQAFLPSDPTDSWDYSDYVI